MRWCLVLAIASCAVGAPPGFPSGDHWTIPLVGPLEDGLLLVPATVNGHGPFVFAIDPDAMVSIVDEEVIKTADLRTSEGPHLVDESDQNQPRIYAVVLGLTIGKLVIERRSAMVVKKGAYDFDGRRVHGVLGRDVLAESLVFGFDRDQGNAYLMTQKVFTAPTQDNVELHFNPLSSRVQNAEVMPISRRLAKASIGGETFTMHLDLGATASQLREGSWDKAKLARAELKGVLIDEVATSRAVNSSGIADAVSVGNATTSQVLFVPYGDKRWPEQDLDGSLGLGFFRPFAVWADWEKSMLYLRARKDPSETIVTRIARWSELASCAHTGCATVTITDPLAGKPADQLPAKHPGVVVSFVRDSAAQTDLEVLVAVAGKPGQPPLQWLVANMPKGVDRAMTHLSAEYVGAVLRIVDASPFPRSCTGEGGCIAPLQAPLEPVSATPMTQSGVRLHRVSGDMLIMPSVMVAAQNATHEDSVKVSFEVCIDPTGAVRDVRITRSTGFNNLDQSIVARIKETWKYEPVIVEGKAIEACARETHEFSTR